jgi:UDP-glucose 4-epimerase
VKSLYCGSVLFVSKFIHISTADVVGRNNSSVITESSICYPISPYGINKLAIEKLLENYFVDFNILEMKSTFMHDK